MAGPAGVIGDAGQRPVDAGRGHFEIVLAFDGVLRIEEFRQCPRQPGAIFHIHQPVGALGHDLQRLSLGAEEPEAHEAIARRFDGGGDDRLQMRQARDNGVNPCVGRPIREAKSQNLSPAAVLRPPHNRTLLSGSGADIRR
jgi:hypothetical protein